MEIAHFFKFILKNLSVLILIPIVTVLITYFLVRSLPDKYTAQAQISTGIIDKSDEINLTDAPPLQQSEIEQKFSNFIQMMQMQRLVNLVSYKLIIHDLSSKNPFKKPSPLIEALTPEQRAEMITLAQKKYKSKEPLNRTIKKEAQLSDLINSLKYDAGAIKGGLQVFRIGQSDFINLDYESTSPDLSAFTVNNICLEFINYYTNIIKNTGQKSVNYLSKLLVTKQEALDNKMKVLKYYKITNGVLNLPEQAKILYGQMIEVQDRQAQVQKQITSISGAIKAIDSKFSPRDREFFEANQSKINNDILTYKEESKVLSDKFIDNDFDPIYKKKIDSVSLLIKNKINEASDEYIFNPFAVKQDLIAQKIALQTELEIAKNSVESLNQFHDTLYGQFSRLVPFEASIQSYERDIEIASQEYLEILNRYNYTSMQTTFLAKLKLSQPAVQGTLQPSKKMLLILLSGIISFVFCVLVLFALFYFDDATQSAKQLADKTELPVIGQLDFINNSSLNIKDLWSNATEKSDFKEFKDQLRSIRLELNQELKGSKILAITSLGANEGKTFIALNLAYTYAVTNKKILLIDGNFAHPELTNSVKSEALTYIEDFLLSGDLNTLQNSVSGITIMGNHAGNKSVLEIVDEETITQRFNHLKSLYDLILVETPALTITETSKEWILFAEKVIGVFEFKDNISDTKKEQLSFVKSIESKFIGWVFNKIAVNAPKKQWFKKFKNG